MKESIVCLCFCVCVISYYNNHKGLSVITIQNVHYTVTNMQNRKYTMEAVVALQ